MPDPAPPPGSLYWKADTTVTNEKYHEANENENRIMAPPGRSPCVKNINQDRKKLNDNFLRSFFALMEKADSFFWLYRKVKKGKLYGKTKNQNPVRRTGSKVGGYGRGISEVLPSMVAAEKAGAEEPGSDERTRVHGRIL